MSQSSWLVTVAWRMGHSLSPTKVSTKDLWSNKKPTKKTQCLGSGKILKPTRINSYDSYFIYFQYANWQQRKNINIHEYPALMPLQDSFFLFVFVSLFCSTSVNFQTHYPTTVELNISSGDELIELHATALAYCSGCGIRLDRESARENSAA